MADGLYWVVGCVYNGEEGGQDPEQDGGGHQGDGGDVQLVQQERSLPKHIVLVKTKYTSCPN